MTPNEEIEELIRTKANDKLEALIKEQPQIASGKTEQGASYLLYAAYCRNKGAIDLIKKGLNTIDIYEAAAIGDISKLTELATDKQAINSFSADGFTPLGLACFFRNYEIAKYLVEQGADVNMASSNEFNVAPIHSAIAVSNMELTQMLLKHGANVNAKQIGGVTPLHEAAHNGETEIAQLLIDHKADVNAKMDNGRTPLFMAEERACIETAELIRAHGGR